MPHKYAKLCALAAFALGLTTVTAEAANCEGRRDTGTAVGAIGGGLVGNAASHGNAGGTISGAVIGGFVGKVVCGNQFEERYNTRGVPHDRAGHYFHKYRYSRPYCPHHRP